MTCKLASIEINRDCDEDGDYGDKDFSEFEQLIDSNENLRNINCIGIHTGYTERIMNARYQKQLNYVVCFASWIRYREPVIVDAEIHNIVKKVITEGIVVFKDHRADNVFKYVDMLHDADYCGFCHIDSIYKIEWHKVDDKTIMICYVDCESG